MQESKVLMFMPWCPIEKEYSAGEYRLVPLDLGDVHTEEEAEIKKLLKPYRTIENEQLTRVGLIQVGDGPIARHLNESEVRRAFDFAEYACFCSLSERTAHISSSKVNRDCFTLYPQEFNEATLIALRSRRLGGINLDGRNIDTLFISAPIHCDLNEITLNNKLLVPLVENYMEDEIWLNAITCFNRANTDSDSVPEYTEFILLSGAFDRILSSGQKLRSEKLAIEFANRFQPFMKFQPLVKFQPLTKLKIKEWFLKFLQTRHGPAHGDLSREYLHSSEGWQILVTAKLAFPILLKIILSNEGQYELSDNDVSNILCLQGEMTGVSMPKEKILDTVIQRRFSNEFKEFFKDRS